MKKVELKLFLTFLVFSILFVRWYGWNEESHFALLRAIVDGKRFEIDSYCNQTGDRAIYKDHCYSDKDPGLAFLSSPIYFGWELLYKIFPENFRERYAAHKGYISEIYGKTSVVAIVDRGFFVFTSMILITILTSGIFSALTGLLVFKISSYFLKKKRDRIILAIAYFFGTIASNYSLNFMNHASSTFFLFLSFFLLFRVKKKRSYSNYKYVSVAATLLGISFVLDRSLLLFFPVFLFYSFFLNKKLYSIFLIFLTLSILPYVFYNYSIFGNPFEITSTYIDRGIYKHAYPLQQKFSIWRKEVKEASFIDLETLVKRLHLKLPPYPNLMIMLRLLFYPYRGLFFYSPILILAVPGLFLMWKRYKMEVGMIVFMILSLLSLISMRTLWWGGLCFGPRYLLSLIPFLMIPVSFFLKKFGIRVFLVFLLISIFINLLGLQKAEDFAYDWSIRDIKPEWREMQNTFQIIYNPILEHYLPLFLKYGPRSNLFEQLTNGYISIDIRIPPLARGSSFPFSNFYIPFLSLFLLILMFGIIWCKELSYGFRHLASRFKFRNLY